MSEATKKAAEAKLALYPQQDRLSREVAGLLAASMVKRDDLLGNVNRGRELRAQRNLNKLGKPVDEKEWEHDSADRERLLQPEHERHQFPGGNSAAAFLFDKRATRRSNFGGIGVVIGHEMTHGFDDQGSKYDGKGNVREWRTPADRKAFNERTDCEVKEYDGFEAGTGAEAERQADARREHGGQRRHSHCVPGAA